MYIAAARLFTVLNRADGFESCFMDIFRQSEGLTAGSAALPEGLI